MKWTRQGPQSCGVESIRSTFSWDNTVALSYALTENARVSVCCGMDRLLPSGCSRRTRAITTSHGRHMFSFGQLQLTCGKFGTGTGTDAKHVNVKCLSKRLLFSLAIKFINCGVRSISTCSDSAASGNSFEYSSRARTHKMKCGAQNCLRHCPCALLTAIEKGSCVFT